MPQLLSKAPFAGRTRKLLLSGNRDVGLEKAEVPRLELLFSGIKGDMHSGLTRKSDVRTIKQYARDTDIRNVRQLTIVSEEELVEIADLMGIPDLTLLTPSTRLQFPSGASIVVDMENFPCRQVADVVAQHHPEPKAGLVASAMHKRGVTAWVEREGIINVGDEIIVWVPPQRLYAHMGS